MNNNNLGNGNRPLGPVPAPPWRHDQPGDTLVGTIVGVYWKSRQGQDVAICQIRRENGELVDLWISGTVLIHEFARPNPQPGDKIAVTFLGVPQGKTYRNYEVVVQPGGYMIIDWAEAKPLNGHKSEKIQVPEKRTKKKSNLKSAELLPDGEHSA